MKIKTKLQINAILSVVLVLIIIYTIFTTSQQVNKATDKNRLIDKITGSTVDLRTLTYEYLLSHEERPKTQWELKYNSLGEILKSREFGKPEEKVILNSVRKNLEDIKPIFSQLTTNYESQNASKELGERLSSQILVKSYSMISDGFRLAELIRTERAAIQQRASSLTALFVIILAIIIITSLFFNMHAAKLIKKLTQTIDRISKGEFDVGIDSKLKESKDEIGDLSRAFDRTIVSLKLAMKQTSPELKKQLGEKEVKEKMKVK